MDAITHSVPHPESVSETGSTHVLAMLAIARRPALALFAALAGTCMLACGSYGGPGFDGFDTIERVVAIQLRSGSTVTSLTMTMAYWEDVKVVSVEPGDPPLATASCQETIGDREMTATCTSTAPFAAPLDAWRIRLSYSNFHDAVEGISSLECEATDASGATFPVECVAVRVP